MNTIEEKFEEIKYRIERLTKTKNDGVIFKYEINAFIASAHSIMSIVIRKYRKKDPGFKIWLENYHNSTLDFFKKQRNMTLHEKSITPSADVILRVNEHLFSGKTESTTEYVWYYEGSDEIDAISLSKKYLEEIETFVEKVYSIFGET